MATKPEKNPKGEGIKLIASNRRAGFDYFLGDRYEAGVMLTGTEVKVLREGKGSLNEAFVRIDREGEVWLEQAHIPEYLYGTNNNHKPTRRRKLLLHKLQITRLAAEVAQQGVTLVPTRLYFSKGRAKLEFAVGKGKNTSDKRQSLKDKQATREVARAVKDFQKS